jgi:hypothetical protein
MKDFIIYVQPKIGRKDTAEQEYSLDYLERFPGTSRLQELEFVRNGRLRLIRELEPHRVFKFSCEYLKRLVAATKPIYAPLDFELWQRKHAPLTVTFEAPKKASRVAVSLLSLVDYGDPYAISPITLTVSDFKKLKENILQEHSGHLTQIILQNIRSEKGTVRRFLMTGSALEQFLNLDELLRDASRVSGMGFAIHSFYGERRFSFRIKDWGGGQIYSPANPFDHEISGLLELFEENLFPGFSNSTFQVPE